MSEILVEANHQPVYVFEDGHFYCDGVRVQPSQMTEEEIKKYVPASFQSAFFRAIGIEEVKSNG